MDLIEEFTDLGAPEFAVTSVARIERISPGQVRITKYSRRPEGNVITHHEVWDYKVWQDTVEAYQRAAQTVIRAGLGDGGEQRKRGREH